MIVLALRLALIALAYPVMLIVAFVLWHACYCTMYGGGRFTLTRKVSSG